MQDQILQALHAGQTARALALAQAWVAQAPDHVAAWHWLGMACDAAGQADAAIDAWTRMQRQLGQQGRAPLPPQSAAGQRWPAMAERAPDARRVVLVWGAPGSAVDRLAAVMEPVHHHFSVDRFGDTPPDDGFQDPSLVAGLADGSIDPAEVAARWWAALPARGLLEGTAADWLQWWDNALLHVLRPYLPEATLVIALRDPRDMLLDWLAYGAAAAFAPDSPQAAADWLAVSLGQVVTLDEEQLFPHRILRTDAIGHDPAAATAQINQLFGTSLAAPPHLGRPRLPAGHWRHYIQALAGPLATLAPMARRLGYPAE
jgi:hypothetical protein